MFTSKVLPCFFLALLYFLIFPASNAETYADDQQEESTKDEIPELKRVLPSTINTPYSRRFQNQADPEKVPPRSADPVQGNCDRNKINCDRKSN